MIHRDETPIIHAYIGWKRNLLALGHVYYYNYYLVCEAIVTAATPGLLCQPRVIVKMIVEKQMECRLVGETEVLE
jgi:hypothetical protein